MNKILKITLLASFLGLASLSNAQVIMNEFLSKNHEGMVEHSVNNGGKKLYYKFQYDSVTGARIKYTLYLYKDASKSQPFLTLPVLMRNLIWTYFLDVSFTKDGSSKVAALIYKKDLRWSRVKFSPHEGCSYITPPIWDRLNQVDNYEKLLQNTIQQLDKNVNFNCYAATAAK